MRESLLKNKLGLSTVVTTLIILVVAVLLATVVTFYATNITSTRVQEESLLLTKQHIWYNATGTWSEAALAILNTGGRDVVIDKITVRGRECPWSNVYYWKTENPVQGDLNVTNTELSGTSVNIEIDGQTRSFNQCSRDLTLKSGWMLVLYIKNPDTISSSDVGRTVGITVFTVNAQYYVEANVEAAG
ncbi:hypothetical protein H5T51_04385 [Candidatus Bathyarchaeota archaeon]|nr:hypothetical protein [Candidatus Bathyarchaeota archaeon]